MVVAAAGVLCYGKYAAAAQVNVDPPRMNACMFITVHPSTCLVIIAAIL